MFTSDAQKHAALWGGKINTDNLRVRSFSAAIAAPEKANRIQDLRIESKLVRIYHLTSSSETVLGYGGGFFLPEDVFLGELTPIPKHSWDTGYPYGEFWVINGVLFAEWGRRGLLQLHEAIAACSKAYRQLAPVSYGVKRGGLTPYGAESAISETEEFLRLFRLVEENLSKSRK